MWSQGWTKTAAAVVVEGKAGPNGRSGINPNLEAGTSPMLCGTRWHRWIFFKPYSDGSRSQSRRPPSFAKITLRLKCFLFSVESLG